MLPIGLPDYFTLPDLHGHCPFPLRQNPHYNTARATGNEWLRKVDYNDTDRRRWEACDFALLVAYSYPSASKERLQIVCDWLTIFFAYDDVLDATDLAKNPFGTKWAVDILMNSSWHPYSFKTDFRIVDAWQSVWVRALETGCSPVTQRRYLEHLQKYCHATHDQVTLRSKETIADVQTYTRMRRDTGAMLVAFIIGEFALDLHIPEHVYEHPLIQTMETCASDVVWLSNDIYSWNLEQSQGHDANMITVFMKQEGVSLQEAIDLTANMVYERFAQFVDCNRRLPASWGSDAIDADVRAYLTNLEDWCVGCNAWSLEVPRYFGKDVEEVSKTLRVRVLPGRGLKNEGVAASGVVTARTWNYRIATAVYSRAASTCRKIVSLLQLARPLFRLYTAMYPGQV